MDMGRRVFCPLFFGPNRLWAGKIEGLAPRHRKSSETVVCLRGQLVVQFVATGLMFWDLMGQGGWFMDLAWYWKGKPPIKYVC